MRRRKGNRMFWIVLSGFIVVAGVACWIGWLAWQDVKGWERGEE